MADPAEREERVWTELKETKAELRLKDEELKDVRARLLDEVRKPAEQQNANLIANLQSLVADLQSDKSMLNAQWTALNADFQQLLAAAGISGMHLPRNSCRHLCVQLRSLG